MRYVSLFLFVVVIDISSVAEVQFLLTWMP